MGKRIAFHHFGCKVNFAESSSLSRQLREKGYEVTSHKEMADVYVISTCAVTREAEKKCIYAIRQAHRRNPNAQIAVIGCFSELSPAEIKKIDGVSMVLGQSEKFNLPNLLEDAMPKSTDLPPSGSFVPSFSLGDRTRSFLKIQDGCDYFCSYCTIPLARGRSRSDRISHITAEAMEIAAAGMREIILTGVNIGDFGRHNGETFLELLKELDGIENIPRIRISSIEPDLLSDDIISFVAASRNIMPHFHIPLQAGSDRILHAMHRRYNTALYAGRIAKIRSLMPLACIAADVITGFPGESDADFADTFQFLKALDISYMHVFSFSKRENTLAAKMEGQLPGSVVKLRSEQLHHLSDRKKRYFYELNRGMAREALFESDNVHGFMHGFTENYIKVKTPFDPEKVNALFPVLLEELDEEGCYII